MKIYLSLAALLVASTACTQNNLAKVTHHGDQFFGRNTAATGKTMVRQNMDFREEPEVARAAPTDMIESVELAPPPEAVSVTSLPAPGMNQTPDYAASARTAPNSASPSPSAPPPIIARAPEVSNTELGPLFELSELESMQKSAVLPSSTPALTNADESLIWPVKGDIIGQFGKKQNGLSNDGINIKANQGEPIWAASSGEVVYAGNELKGYGNMVILRHPNGMMTSYAHASDVLVDKGQQVAQGDLLGYVGRTGSVSEPQLHFGIRMGKQAIDPESKLPHRLASR
tara:strand:+ start:347 stop:1204 length:858 start_codon:yes stop_codon:yes gene_type:complete